MPYSNPIVRLYLSKKTILEKFYLAHLCQFIIFQYRIIVYQNVPIRRFHKHTKLAIMALQSVMPTLYSHINICSFYHYLDCKMLVNVKLDVNLG